MQLRLTHVGATRTGPRLRAADGVKNDCRNGDTESGSDLRHGLENGAGDRLFVRRRDFCNEDCSRRKDEVRSQNDNHRRWEAVGPVCDSGLDDGKQQHRDTGQDCTGR